MCVAYWPGTQRAMRDACEEEHAEFYFEDALCLRRVGGTGSGKQGRGV